MPKTMTVAEEIERLWFKEKEKFFSKQRQRDVKTHFVIFLMIMMLAIVAIVFH